MFKKILYSCLLLLGVTAAAQDSTFVQKDSAHAQYPQKDLTDVVKRVFHSHKKTTDSAEDKKKLQFSILPAAGYTLQTGLAAVISANVGFYNGTDYNQKMSSVTASLTYTQYSQIILPFNINIWTKGNKFNFITDFRYLKYPSGIYGLGEPGISSEENSRVSHAVDYFAVKFHQSAMADIADNLFVGLGYYYDQFWDIESEESGDNPQMAALINNKLGSAERASGPVLRILYDSRINQINSNNGLFVNLQYRSSMHALGSDYNWASMLLDVRKYIPFPKNSNNVLAFWGYTWLSASKNQAPYLMLPSVGWDDQYNTGRGYIQSRFRGKNMYYYENEYRFPITRNGLFGAVVFANAELFSADLSKEFNRVNLGYGAGLRIKLNKHSNTNLSIDYGFGSNSSKGLFVNLGEVF